MTQISKLVTSKKEYDPQNTAYTCQSACIAMVTGGDEMTIRAALTANGEAGDPAVMGNYLRTRVKEYKFEIAASLNDFRGAIDQGYSLITHTYLTQSGHVIKISGYEVDTKTQSYRFIVDDPWAEFNFASWSYPDPNQSGNDVRYSSYGMYAAAVASVSFGDAARIYRNGELDSARHGAWLHMIRN